MSSLNDKKTLLRRGATLTASAVDNPGRSQIGTQGQKLKILFVDDNDGKAESSAGAFLYDLNNAITQYEADIEHRSFIPDGTNGLIQHIHSLIKGAWRPDIVLLDMLYVGIGAQTGHDYLRELRADDALVDLPIILQTKAESIEKATRTHNLSYSQALREGADGILLGKRGTSSYLERCQLEFPQWELRARERLWNGLLEGFAKSVSETKRLFDLNEVLNEHLIPQLQPLLGFEFASLRQKSGDRWPLVAYSEPPWVGDKPTDSLTDVPLIARCIHENSARAMSVASISSNEAGLYPALLGKAMYGRLLRSGDAVVGVLTFVRQEHPSKFEALDRWMFERLSDLVAGALAKLMEIDRQHVVTDAFKRFVKAAERVSSKEELAGALCEILDSTLHPRPVRPENYQHTGNVSLRLVEHGTPFIRQVDGAGTALLSSVDLPLYDTDSDDRTGIYRRVLTSGQRIHLRSKAEVLADGDFIENDPGSWQTGSALCEPIYFEKPSGSYGAMGSITVQCSREHAYSDADVAFVEVLANAVSEVLQRIRAQECAATLSRFAVKAYASNNEPWDELNTALFAICGHSQLISVVPDFDQPTEPWRVQTVLWHAGVRDVERDVECWQHLIQEHWHQSFARSSIEKFTRGEPGPLYTEYSDLVERSDDLVGNKKIRANCAIAVRDAHGLVIAVLFLQWFHPPSLAKQELPLLNEFASYASEVITLGQRWLDARAKLQANEQAARLGFASQSLKHVFDNRLADLSAQISVAIGQLEANRSSELRTTLFRTKNLLESLDRRTKSTLLYLKPVPAITSVRPLKLWAELMEELVQKARRSDVTLLAFEQTEERVWEVRADEDILTHVLYALLDNAIEAASQARDIQNRKVWLELLTDDTKEKIYIDIRDTGHGITKSVRKRLFERGKSSKGDHQGIALFIAKGRVEDMYGSLVEVPLAADQGACFRVILPVWKKDAYV